MQTLYEILGLIGGVLILWVLYQAIKGRPQQFSRENLSKSFSTMGMLALLLIAFVALLVFSVRQS